jgi:hypothetical protein
MQTRGHLQGLEEYWCLQGHYRLEDPERQLG